MPHHRPSNVVPESGKSPLELLDDAGLIAYSRKQFGRTVKPPSALHYQTCADRVERAVGGLTYKYFVGYMKEIDDAAEAEPGKEPLRTATLRNMKSAVMWVCWLEGKGWTKAQSDFVGTLLRGRAASDKPKAKRGQMDEAKVRQVRNLALARGRPDIADGILVVNASCCRPPGHPGLT